MRRHGSGHLIFDLALVMLLCLVVVTIGCSGGGGSEGALAMMKKLPRDAGGLSFTNVRALRDDKDFNKAYETLKDLIDSDFQTLAISADDVDTMTEGGSLTMLEGHFDLAEVRTGLERNNYDKDEYKGIETWKGSDSSVALISGSFIVIGYGLANVEDCVDVIKGDGDSLYDDEDLRDVLSRAPAGIGVSVDPGLGYYEGLKAVANSGGKKDADTIWVTSIFLFEDEDAAAVARVDIENGIKGTGVWQDIVVIQDREYVRCAADGDIENASWG